MKKDNIRGKVLVVSLFVLLITTLTIFQTYALFETNASGAKTLNISDWSITLNDIDVSQSRTVTLDDFHYTNGVHTKANRFAPASSAYFDLEIDASNSQVSVEYELEIDDSEIDDYPNIYFSITDLGTNQELDSNTYSGTILLSDQSRVVNLRITLLWDDDPNYDETDTSLIGESLAFTINADFKQYLGA